MFAYDSDVSIVVKIKNFNSINKIFVIFNLQKPTMRILSVLIATFFSLQAFSQHEYDSAYSRCPVSIKDTTTGNDYFIEHLPSKVTTYRKNGDYTIVIEQKSQFFTVFFHTRKFSIKGKGKFNISVDEKGNGDVNAKYSFRSGSSVAYLDVINGRVETTYDKVTKLWHIVLIGLIGDMGDTRVNYFKAKVDLFVK